MITFVLSVKIKVGYLYWYVKFKFIAFFCNSYVEQTSRASQRGTQKYRTLSTASVTDHNASFAKITATLYIMYIY